MVYRKIYKVEQRIREQMDVNRRKMMALDDIKFYLDQLDYKSERIPEEREELLETLIMGIKESELDEFEKIMVDEIIGIEEK